MFLIYISIVTPTYHLIDFGVMSWKNLIFWLLIVVHGHSHV